MEELSLQEQINIILPQLDLSNSKRLLFVVPESAGDIFLSTSLLKSLKEAYPDTDIYFSCKPEYKSILKNNPYIKKTIDYLPIMETQPLMEGAGQWSGLFMISIMATIFTQRQLNYLNHGISKIMFNLRKS